MARTEYPMMTRLGACLKALQRLLWLNESCAAGREALVAPLSHKDAGRGAPLSVTVYAMAGADPDTGAWRRVRLESIPLLKALDQPNLLVVKMDDSSMEPVIRRHAYVGLDGNDIRFRSGEIYALDIPGEGLVLRRVARDLDNRLLHLLSDDRALPSRSVPLDAPGLTSVGRVVWIIQDL